MKDREKFTKGKKRIKIRKAPPDDEIYTGALIFGGTPVIESNLINQSDPFIDTNQTRKQNRKKGESKW